MTQELKALIKKYEVIIWVFFTTLTIFGLLIGVVYQQFMAYVETQTVLQGNRDKLATLQNRVNVLKNTDLAQTTKNYSLVTSALPKEKDLIYSLNQIELLIRQNNLQRQDITFSSASETLPSTEGVKLDNFIINLEVTGTLTDIKNFLTSIKDSPRAMRLSNIEMANDRRAPTQYLAAMSVIIIYSSAPEGLNSNQALQELSQTDLQLLSKIEQFVAQTSTLNTPTTSLPASGNVGKPNPFN